MFSTQDNVFAIILSQLLSFLNFNLDTKSTVTQERHSLKSFCKSINNQTQLSNSRNLVYLGQGFEFTPKHTKALYDLIASGFQTSLRSNHGCNQIHNLCLKNKENVYTNVDDLRGHTVIFGTTGSGKTRFFDLLISQAIMRGDSVIILDPKADFDLKNKALNACLSFNRDDHFKVLDLNNLDECSYPINLIGSSLRPTQIADKLASLMIANGKSSDAFVAYANEAIAGAVIALQVQNLPITIAAIKKNMSIETYTKSCVSYLINEVLRVNDLYVINYFLNLTKDFYFDRKTDLESLLTSDLEYDESEHTDNHLINLDTNSTQIANTQYSQSSRYDVSDDSNSTQEKSKRPKALSSVQKIKIFKAMYDFLCTNEYSKENADIDFLFSLALKDEGYFSKVTAGVGPMLNSLTLSNLNNILSSQSGKKIANVINDSDVLYVSLNSLKDATLGGYVGKLLLGDLSSYAGTIYSTLQRSEKKNGNNDINPNHSGHHHINVDDQINPEELHYSKETVSCIETTDTQPKSSLQDTKPDSKLKRVSIFIDEASEVVNDALVQLLNKSRGANFSITIATQTFADLSKRCGSDSAAMQIIGNCNTMISLRVKDTATASLVTSTLPSTKVSFNNISRTKSNSNDSYVSTNSMSAARRDVEVSLFPSSALMMLPDFEYIAKLSDGRLVKGIIPIVK